MIGNEVRKVLFATHLNVLAYKVAKRVVVNKSRERFSPEEVESARRLLGEYHPDVHSSALTKNSVQALYDLHIIVPMYKVEEYIEACIDSVVSQETDYSYLVTIINDGSPDRSREIVRKYEGLPSIEIIDQENSGISGARNRGLSDIKGRYVMFLDSDDALAPNAIASLLDAAFRHDADIVQGAHNEIDERGGRLKTVPMKGAVSGQGDCELRGYPWGKVFKSELFENIHFPEGYWFEDTICVYLLFPLAKSKVCIPDIVYNYRRNHSGITYGSLGKVKNIDTLYISEALVKDAMSFDFSKSYSFYSQQFDQIGHNYRRIATIRNERIDRAAFIVHCAIMERYYAGMSLKDDSFFRTELEGAVKSRNYSLYKLVNNLLYA